MRMITFTTSFPPVTLDEIISFFEDDFGNENKCPFSRKEMTEFLASGNVVLYSNK